MSGLRCWGRGRLDVKAAVCQRSFYALALRGLTPCIRAVSNHRIHCFVTMTQAA